jgi:CRP-like cAMP-binding protein
VPKSWLMFEQGSPGSRFYIIVSGSVSFHQQPHLVKAGKTAAIRENRSQRSSVVSMDDLVTSEADTQTSTMLPADVMEGREIPLWENVETLFGNCMATLYAGAGFGEKALRYDERRWATAITREDTVVLSVNRNTMKSLEALAAEEEASTRRPAELSSVLAPANRQRSVLELQVKPNPCSNDSLRAMQSSAVQCTLQTENPQPNRPHIAVAY